MSPRLNVTRKVRLSETVGESRARDVAAQVYAVKEASGRFYVNEFRQIFAPIGKDLPVRHRYVGLLDIEAGWFPMSV